MSEQEKESDSSPVVLLEQAAASKLKQSFCQNDMKDEGIELHHKRSRAPAVPSVAGELKDNAQSDDKNRPESDIDPSSEKPSFLHIAKILTSKVNKRATSPESITQVTVEPSKKSLATKQQPIPAKVASDMSPDQDLNENPEKAEDADSITDEIAALRTPEVAKKTSMWAIDSQNSKIRKDPFRDLENEKIYELGDRRNVLLESKSSFGPCFKPSTPLGAPSGIALYIPKKNIKSDGEYNKRNQSVINISVSKKCLVHKTKHNTVKPETEPKMTSRAKIFETLKNKISSATVFVKDMLQH